MARGNQRDKSREKRIKEEAKKKHGNTEDLSLGQRRERDAALMRQKQEEALKRKAEEAAK
ncbi:4F5 family protein [Entamoeba histolytica HM-3:IMSS]|uniref:4f5 family protein n=4 Tax=Entamoeba TaxID=5758 RepID=A0A175JIJ2_ENTHI|nr:4F5 family protein [Entamoeba histolytica KU27]EMS13054.1 4F5 family protein [Entamoeba histolytica HM-3:IMSS]GAT93520.1 4f5 family protein [Entamoeba histolytica]